MKTTGRDLQEHSVATASIFILVFHFNWKAAAAVSHETAVAGGIDGSGEVELPRGLCWETALALRTPFRACTVSLRRGGLRPRGR